ncbi:3-oxo-tetronate kinase [Enterocloster lavalensis]|uniref:3-oxo-tetronate kinase n=1 Tax=Enterocloster lavalensis TaxID=460384 RepID=UPI001D06932E|nr:3-oxo-tetronate kinase [Enterocloster lavalensis]MCB6346108.1 four-carbon acid sugar kinase family protein [Enterocloster lavalensis]
MLKERPEHILLGCVADDFTGASDAASFLAKQGIKTLLFNGTPQGNEVLQDCAAVVIALKTRSIPAAEAVRETLKAVRWLKQHGAEQLYLKDCSTFDSTPEGNIGPDIDAVLEAYQIPYTILCPALPINRRIVKDGVLIVDDKPVAEGHMANHPLNPIWDSRIEELMRPQGKYPCMILDGLLLEKPRKDILEEVEKFGKDKAHFYIVPDYTTDAQGKKIAEVFGDNRLLTGGSGILEHLAERYKERYDCAAGQALPTGTPGKGIALSGSCSTATCVQCKAYAAGRRACAIDPKHILDGSLTAEDLWEFISESNEDSLVYSAGATDLQSRIYADEETAARAAGALEQTLAALARRAFEAGYTRIIAAGGETSGAVALALGFDGFIIGESIAPGVPVMIPLNHQNIRIALKSGNFGQPDFFERALAMMKAD